LIRATARRWFWRRTKAGGTSQSQFFVGCGELMHGHAGHLRPDSSSTCDELAMPPCRSCLLLLLLNLLALVFAVITGETQPS